MSAREQAGPDIDAIDHRPVKCLLVDDREDNLVSLEALLAGEPLDMFKARSGAEALELLLRHDFALALVDVQMPGMNGFELAEYMRGTERTRTIPIIFVTAAGSDVNRVFKGYEAGAVDFMAKPLSAHVVKSKIRVFIELFRQRQRLREQLAALQHSKQEVERALSVRNRFISIAGHELRTPLTVLRMQVQVSRNRLPASGDIAATEMHAMLAQLDRQIARLLPLVDEMLDASRIESGKLTLRLTQCDFGALVEEAAARMRPLLDEAGCDMQVTIDAALHGTWDRYRLEQVVTNLLSNAARYGAGAPVHVSVHGKPDTVELSVRDHGPGISADDQHRIFEPFERARQQDDSAGLGLGLHIVRTIVEMHAGTIGVWSTPGDGACFRVRLPRQPAVAAAAGHPASA